MEDCKLMVVEVNCMMTTFLLNLLCLSLTFVKGREEKGRG